MAPTLSTYLPVCLHTYQPTYLPTDLPPCLITYLSTYVPTDLPPRLITYLPNYVPTYLMYLKKKIFIYLFGGVGGGGEVWPMPHHPRAPLGPALLTCSRGRILVLFVWVQRCWCWCCCCSCSCCCAWSRGFVCLLLQCSPSSHTAAWPRRLPILVAFHSRWLNNKLLLLIYCSGIISIISYCANVTRPLLLLLLLLRLGCLRLLLLLFFFRCNLSVCAAPLVN